MNKRILLINDLAGYGKVALSAMIPVLAKLGYTTSYLPTALVSNTLDYGKFNILETTEYMQESIKNWQALGFNFTAVATGFILSEQQAKIVYEYCEKLKKQGSFICVDPIMGDEGQLYNGVSRQVVEYLRLLIGVADVIVPNYTEACYLTNNQYFAEGMNDEQVEKLVFDLRSLGTKSIVITSAIVNGRNVNICYDDKIKAIKTVEFTQIPVRFPGTGDIFSAILLGSLLKNIGLYESVKEATQKVYQLIDLNKNNSDKLSGITIEEYLEVLCNE